MSDIQYRSKFTNKNEVSADGLYAVGYAESIWREVNQKFKEWEVRRGFVTEEQQALGLRGRAFSYGQFANKKKNQEKSCEKSGSVTKVKTTTSSKSKKVASGKKPKKSARSTSRKSR